MSILDNNKKKRDQKSSETEKELALANLQDRFLGAKAPKADFLEPPNVTISPALLPKTDKAELQTCEKTQTFGDHSVHFTPPPQSAKSILKVDELKKSEVSERAVGDLQPESQSTSKVEPDLQQSEVKPLTSFDFLAVGIKPAQENTSKKTKSFLAHFAKKDKPDKKDE